MRRLALLLVVPLLLTACNDEDGTPSAAEPTGPASRPPLTPIQLPPEPPPTGRLLADIEQSSRDGAANRFQVWVDNDTDTLITPTRITYDDQRFRAPLPGDRLRDIPSQSRRGFQFTIPGRPACGRAASSGTVTVDYTVAGEQRSATVEVADEADVVQRVTAARCLDLAIAQVADLSFADEVTGDGTRGSVGTMTLQVRTTGRPGHSLVIDTIAGNPVLSPGEQGSFFAAGVAVVGDQPSFDVAVPLRPTRCDAHAFGESGSFAAFTFNVHLDGEAGQFVVRLGETAAANAIAYAKASCGFLTSIGGGAG